MFSMTIKTRLTLLFTFLVAVILSAYTLGTYSYARHQRSEEFYSELLTNAIATAAIVLRSDNLSPKTLQPFQKQTLKTLPYERIAIFNKQGRCVFHSGEQILQLSEYEQQQAMKRGRYEVTSRDTAIGLLSEYEHDQATKNGKFSVEMGDTQKIIIPFLDENGNFPAHASLDSESASIPSTGSVEYIVAISAVDKSGLKSLSDLKKWLVGGYIAALFVVFFTGIFFASRAMSPISDIRQKAERISATDLHVRIDEGARKDELYQLARAFNGMLGRIETAFESQKRFVAHASHELRTPLTTIAGQLDVSLLHSRTEEEYRTTIASALESTRQVNRLLTNLLLLAQTESELLKSVRVDDTLFAALKDVQQQYPNREIDIQLNVAPDQEDLLTINGNEGLVKIAIVNILENAIKFSAPSSTVEIFVEVSAKEGVRVKIKDAGIGILEQDLAKVFQPFFRSNPSSEIPGHGIGLTLVKTVMDRLGGDVSVESAPGRGTVVLLSFPVFDSAQSA